MSASTGPAIRPFQFDNGIVGALKNSVNLYRGQCTLPLPLLTLSGRNGLSVSLRAIYQGVTKAAATTWNMDDPTGVLGLGWFLPLEQITALPAGDAAPETMSYMLMAGGQQKLLIPGSVVNEYVAQDYEFWKIVFNPRENSWTVLHENGETYLYGGTEGFIETGVRWDNWNGSSVQEHGKTYPKAWNLRQITTMWGDSITFTYDYDQVAIGSGRASYTRSSRLKGITDTYGRTVSLNYAEKTDTITIREIQLPHVDPRGSKTSAFQDHYETKYLTSIEVKDGMGEMLFDILFRSSPHNFGDTRNPYLYKRCLDGINVRYPGAAPEPGFDFQYNAADHLAPGSLQSVSYPEGGTASYVYDTVALENAPLIRQIDQESGVPRVWFGQNYVVVTHQQSTHLLVSTYDWDGGWSKAPVASVAASAGVDDLRVVTGPGCFVVYYQGIKQQGATNGHIFLKDPYQPDHWLPTVISQTIDSVIVGNNCILAHVSGSRQVLRYQIAGGRVFQQASFSLAASEVALASSGTRCAALAYDTNTKQTSIGLFAQEASGDWSYHPCSTAPNLDLYWDTWVLNSFWSMGVDFATATFLHADQQNYTVALLRWDRSVSSPQWQVLGTYPVPSQKGVPFTVSGLRENVIGNTTHLWRFDSGQLLTREFRSLPPTPPPDEGHAVSLTYGSDIAVQATIQSGFSHYELATYDPYQTTWSSLRQAGTAPLGPDGPYPATLGTDYLTIGRDIYFRGATSDWQRVQGGVLGDSVNLQSVKNLGPQFILSEDSAGRSTNLVLLKNGEALRFDGHSFLSIQNQRCYVPGEKGERAGTVLVGPQSFITYNANAPFDDGSNLTLYRVINDAMDTHQRLATATVIRGLIFTDITQTQQTVYDYNETTVRDSPIRVARGSTYDITGQVAQFSKVTAIDGIPATSTGLAAELEKPYGSTVKYFLNGVAPNERSVFYPPDDPYSNARKYPALMNGVLVMEQQLDSKEKLVGATFNSWQAFQVPFKNQFAMYLRLRRSVQATQGFHVASLDAQPSDIDALDQGKLPASVTTALKEARMAPGSSISVIVVEGGTNWFVLDDTHDRAFPILQNKQAKTLELSALLRSTMISDYNTVNGQTAKRRASNCEANGVSQWKITETLYLCDIQPDVVQSLHLLNMPVQSSTGYQDFAADSVLHYTGSKATVWWPWTLSEDKRTWVPSAQFALTTPMAPRQIFSWKGKEDAAPHFDAWTSNQPDARYWFPRTRVTHRSVHGQETEKVSPDGVTVSYVYDTNETQPLACFTNASISRGEASYFGFDANESNPGWLANQKEPIPYKEDAHTGTQCYRLSDAALTYNFHPQRPALYLFSCWAKTAADWHGEAQWTFTGPDGQALAAPLVISDTSGQWVYLFRALDLQAYTPTTMPRVTISAASKAGDPVLFDNLRLSLYHASFTGNVVDASSSVVTATLGANGETTQSLINYAQQSVGSIGQMGKGGWVSTYLWRSELPKLDPSRPNAQLSVAARTRASYGRFFPATWRDYWHTDNAAAWQVKKGWLTCQRNLPDTLTLQQELPAGAFALRVEVAPAATNMSPVVIGLGEAITLTLKAGGSSGIWSLQDGRGGALPEPVPNPRSGIVDWSLIASGRTLLFFVGGARIFSYQASQPITGPLRLTIGQVGVALRDLVICVDPIVSRSFTDANNKSIQGHALDGEQAVVNQVIYDAIGRAAVTTKAALLEGNAKNPLFHYRQNFALMDWSGGPMQGEVATYYSPANPTAPSDDQGYPFSRTVFESSPVGRPQEMGSPGLAYAITSREDRHTTRYTYSVTQRSELDAALGDLPVAQYTLNGQADQDGIWTYSLYDKGKSLLATATLLESGQYSITKMSYNGADELAAVRTPASFDPPAGQDPTLFDSEMKYAFDHSLTEVTASDNLRTEYIRDPAGRLRFMQDERGRKEGYFNYWVYDELRRLVETGYLQEPWDKGVLDKHAENLPLVSGQPDWPAREQAGDTWSKQLVYDGDGSHANLIGMLWKSRIHNSDSSTEETFAYDAVGRVLLSTLRSDTQEAESVSYVYDATDNQVSLATGSGFKVFYQYDMLNRLVGVGTSAEDPYRYGAFRYYPGGQIAHKELNRGRIKIPVSYDSSGRLLSIGNEGSHFTQRLSYELHTDGSVGYYNGRIASTTDRVHLPDAPEGFTFDYTYNYLGQLQAARCSHTEWSIGDRTPVAYDANGNIQHFQAGESNQSYRYLGNLVERVEQEAPSSQWSFGYNANGDIDQSERKNLRLFYDRSTHLPTSIQVGSDTSVTYRYDASLRRISERFSSNGVTIERLLSYAASDNPIVETISNGSSSTRLFYIYGASGLLAIEGDAPYFVLTDSLGSSRLLLDEESQLVAGYDYLPFGALARSYGPQPALLTHLYTGQRWDAATGLYNYRARLYDPDLRRFYARDPVEQYASPYVYVGNNPISLIDPTGMYSSDFWWSWIVSTIVSLVEVIAGIAVDILAGAFLVATFGLGAGASAALADIVGGGLIGAGLGGLSYNISAFSGDPNISAGDFWKGWGIQTGIGAAVGVLTAGFGEFGGLAADAIRGGEAVVSTLRAAGAYAVEAAINGVGGALVGGAGQVFQNLAEGKNSDTNLGGAVIGGALAGFAGSLLGRGANKLGDQFSRSSTPDLVVYDWRWVLGRAGVGLASGFVLSLVSQVVTDKIDGQQDWTQSFWLSVITGSILGAIPAIPKLGPQEYQYRPLADARPNTALDMFDNL